MKKAWRIFAAAALVCSVMAVLLAAVGFFTGGSPVTIQSHGSLTGYAERLTYNWNVLTGYADRLLLSLGL